MSAARMFMAAVLGLGIPVLARAQHVADPKPRVAIPINETQMAMPPVMDDQIYAHVLLDQNEARIGAGQNGYRWAGQAWAGTDYNKIWVKSEGFAPSKGGIEDGRDELLYSRSLGTYLDVQAGVRADWDSGPSRTWGALGVQGLAPFFFEYEATAYLSSGGHAALHLAASYDLLLTQRLILQPEVEMNLYSMADPARGVGAGLSDIDAGLRLRYEISRKFAPYIGITYTGRFGQTAYYAKQEGAAAGVVQFVFGIRSWF